LPLVGYSVLLGGPSILEINPGPLSRLALHEMASDVCEHFSLVWSRQMLVNLFQNDPLILAVLAIQGYVRVEVYKRYKYWGHIDTVQPEIIKLLANASRMQFRGNQISFLSEFTEGRFPSGFLLFYTTGHLTPGTCKDLSGASKQQRFGSTAFFA